MGGRFAFTRSIGYTKSLSSTGFLVSFTLYLARDGLAGDDIVLS